MRLSVKTFCSPLLLFALTSTCQLCAQAGNTAQDTAQAEDPASPSGAPSVESAWSILTAAAHNARRPQSRIQAVAALGTMSSNPRASAMIREAMKDPDLDVRTAAILAAADTKNHALLADIHPLLNDPEPQVVFTAATTLWKEHDRTGEDILRAVADGDRRANPTLMHGAKNDMYRKLHDPSSLALTAGTAGAGMLLGPFGFGIAALEYMRKNGGDSARTAAITDLAEDKSPTVREELVDALGDKDTGVRAAAAKVLGQFHQSSLQEPLGKLFDDPKLPVRLTAAAAYLNCTGVSTPTRQKRAATAAH
jgi:HEAT repeat protein